MKTNLPWSLGKLMLMGGLLLGLAACGGSSSGGGGSAAGPGEPADQLLVLDQTSNLWTINPATLAAAPVRALDRDPVNCRCISPIPSISAAYDAAGRKLYFGNVSTGDIYMVDYTAGDGYLHLLSGIALGMTKIEGLALSPDRSTLYISDGLVILTLDIASAATTPIINTFATLNGGYNTAAMAVLPNGNLVAALGYTGTNPGYLVTYDTTDGSVIRAVGLNFSTPFASMIAADPFFDGWGNVISITARSDGSILGVAVDSNYGGRLHHFPRGALAAVLVKLDPVTGAVTVKGELNTQDFQYAGIAAVPPAAVAAFAPAVPDAPSVTAVAGDKSIEVQLSGAFTASSFTVYYNTNGATIVPSDNTTYTSTLKATQDPSQAVTRVKHTVTMDDSPYTYAATATNSAGTSTLLGTGSVMATPAPGGPSTITVIPGLYANFITWTAVPGADSYNIYYGTAPIADNLGPKLTATDTFIVDTAVTPGTAYYYAVGAMDNGTESALTASSTATPFNTPPSIIANGGSNSDGFGSVNGNQAWFNFTPDGISTAYTLYWGTTPGIDPTIPTTYSASGPAVPFKLLSGFTPGTPYYAVLTSSNAFGTSVASPEIGFAPATSPGTVTDIGYAPVTLDGNQIVINAATDFTDPGFVTLNSDDGISGALPINFTFNFYGVDYTTFYLGTNGLVFFGASANADCCWGAMLPASLLDVPTIAFAWSDMDADPVGNQLPGPEATISYETLGTDPNQKLVIDVQNLSTYSGDGYFTGQIILYQTSNLVEIHTTKLLPNPAYLYTQGVQEDGVTAIARPDRMQFMKELTHEAVRFKSGTPPLPVFVIGPGG